MKVEYEDCKVVHETDSAILVLIPDVDDEEPQWVPQSQVDVDSEIWRKGDGGKLVVSQWFAEQREWV